MANPNLKTTLSAAIGVACLLSAACERNERDASSVQSAPNIHTVEATIHTIETKRTWPATMQPLRVYEILAPYDGRIITMHVAPGDDVNTGIPLIDMVFPDADARRAEILMQVKELESELHRIEALEATRAVSKSDVTSARIRLYEASAELSAIKAIISEGVIKSPSNGTVLETKYAHGSSVVQETLLIRIADNGSMGLRIDVPNSELHHFTSPDAFMVRDENDSTHRIARIIRHGGIAVNTTHLELWLDPVTTPETGAAFLHFNSNRDSMCIPWSALAADDGRSWVAFVDTDNQIHHRDVSTGTTTGTLVEIVSGLETGDTVVLYQPRSHGEGSRITPVPQSVGATDFK